MGKTKLKLKVAFIASEVGPFAKVGGLGDVVGSLPKKLLELGVDVRVITGRYESVRLKDLEACHLFDFDMPFGDKSYKTTVYQACLPGSAVPVYLLEQPQWLSTGPIYDNLTTDPHYTTKRFLFLSAAALQALSLLEFSPHLIHVHDWPTAPVCLLLPQMRASNQNLQQSKTLLTIHNINHEGYADQSLLKLINLDTKNFSPLIPSKKGSGYFDTFAQSLLEADFVNTVSPTYAKELLDEKYGRGLEKILKSRKTKMTGILNGIDTDYFNPDTDRYIPSRYSAKTLPRKADNKQALQHQLGLTEAEDKLLVGMITRLTGQKGMELAISAMSQTANRNFQYVILGTGDKKYERGLAGLQKKFRGQIIFIDRYDPHLARLIYAGSDVFLMPSLFEPCGLTQLLAMRYGTLPVVRDTGGLRDTVIDRAKQTGFGFVFKAFEASALVETLLSAQQLRASRPDKWSAMQKRAMAADFSWNKSAREYLGLYKKITGV